MEMLIVVAVIAVLIAIAVPTFRNAQKESNENADIQAVSALYTEVQAEYEIHGNMDGKSFDDNYRMKEDYNSQNSRIITGELAGLELNGGWRKGNTVFIKPEIDGDTVKYTATYN